MALSNSLRQPACLGLGVADVNRTLDGGLDGALHLAAENASVELVQTLLERGAMVNAPNGEGAAALHLAARRGNLPVLHKLLSDPAVAIDQLDLSRRSALITRCAPPRGRRRALPRRRGGAPGGRQPAAVRRRAARGVGHA